jgi:CHAT domain-containing protein
MIASRPRISSLRASARLCTLLAGWALCVPSSATGAIATTSGAAGVLVEEVQHGSLGERAGLKPGDLLTSWGRPASFPANPFPAAGELATPFDLMEALIEQAPRGRLTLSGFRAGQPRSWTLIEGASVERAAIQVRPALEGETLRRYEDGRHDLENGSIASGMESWRLAAAAAFASGASSEGLWLHYRRAEELLLRNGAAAEVLAAEVALLLTAAGERLAAAELYALSAAQRRSGADLEKGTADARRALAALCPRGCNSLATARLEAELVRRLETQGRFELSFPHLRRVLAMRAAQAPRSLDLAETYLALGDEEFRKGEVRTPLLPYRHSEFLLRQLDPGSLRHVRRLLALGAVIYGLGDAQEGEELVQEALRYFRAVAPISRETGAALNMLAAYAEDRTALREAEEYLRGATEILEGLPPSQGILLSRANSLANLGSILESAGDLEAAEHQGRLALEAQAEMGSIDLADNLAGDLLAVTLIRLGRFGEARGLLSSALAAKPRARRNVQNRARTLRILGELELREGRDLEAARRALAEAVELYESTSLESTSLAYVLRLQGETESALGHHETALRLLTTALARHREMIPGGVDEASTLRLVGLQYRTLGRPAEASQALCAAARTLDRMGDRVGRSEGGSSNFFASKSVFYTDCIESLLERGRKEQAYQELESGRARGLLEMMSRRDLSVGELSSTAQAERKRLRDRYEALYSALSARRPGADPQRDLATRHELDALQRELDALADRLRKESPRFAALHYPQPLDLRETRQVLDPGTVLLAYSLGESQAFLFVVRAAGDPGPGLTVHRLPTTSERLRGQVEAFTRLLVDRRGDLALAQARARALYRLLVAPAATAISGSERILVAPDGPLHSLPFGALLQPDGRYLIEAKPIHTVISATVYAEIKKERRAMAPPREIRVAAFGDPRYPGLSAGGPEEARDAVVPSAHLRGLPLVPLPGTRREVEALGALYPNSQIFVGSAATEEAAKALGRGPRIIHFAGHALLDRRMPINSYLALAIPEQPLPGQENGLLQAWEIFEQVRIDADLVTLSACNTALGKEMGGEGLIGLTRAFQFAGARSVLASLWAIGDGSTSRFMPRFYEHLSAGRTKDEALRQTQIEWIRDPRRSHPSYWAAFQLIGDYK